MLRKSAVALAIILAASSAYAGTTVPATITQQGRLLNTDGTPATGTVMLTFALYADGTTTTNLWTETQSVALDDGYFSVQLGRVTAFTGGVWDGSTRFLGLQVGTDSEMTPREEVTSVPYAMFSQNAIGDITPNTLTIGGPSGAVILNDGTVKVGGTTIINPNGTLAIGTGTQGPSGPIGLQGPSGPIGVDGPSGARGPSGPSGPQGVQGPSGPSGPAGSSITGPSGPSGGTGATGPSGPSGGQGPSGPSGPAGSGGGAQVAVAFTNVTVTTTQDTNIASITFTPPGNGIVVAHVNGFCGLSATAGVEFAFHMGVNNSTNHPLNPNNSFIRIVPGTTENPLQVPYAASFFMNVTAVPTIIFAVGHVVTGPNPTCSGVLSVAFTSTTL